MIGDLLNRRIGPCEVQSLLGAGGMGEVYRARDSELGRDVAIKVLPGGFVADTDRLARFEREARTLAALNHPNIGAIYGLERVGDGRALVLELVEGETLAERIAARRSGLPLTEALPIVRQISDAPEAAHEKGIVHRDLKPANIKITPAGTVKVLDFGLAKTGDGSAGDASHSPTMSIGATRDGVLLGTAAYMSPEQARGYAVDKRTDIWAFGCVLFEVLTGRMAFPGDTISDHIAAILQREPRWDELPESTPSPVRRLLRRCLEKDLKRRLPDIAAARLEIDDALTADPDVVTPSIRPIPRPPLHRMQLAATLAAVALLAATATFFFTRPRSSGAKLPVSRFGLALPPAQALAFSINDRDLALSADGTHLVYTAGADRRLMVRSFDRLDAVQLAGITRLGPTTCRATVNDFLSSSRPRRPRTHRAPTSSSCRIGARS